MLYACQDDSVKKINFCIKNGADINCHYDNEVYVSPLAWALCSHQYRNAKHLIKLGAQLCDKWDRVYSLLHTIEYDRLDIVKILIKKYKIDINGFDEYNNNAPLHAAAESNRLSIAKYLVEQGANVLNANRLGNIPAIVAVNHSNFDVAEFLFEKQDTKMPWELLLAHPNRQMILCAKHILSKRQKKELKIEENLKENIKYAMGR